jgi:hypothetical protein
MQHHRRFKHNQSLEERLTEEAIRLAVGQKLAVAIEFKEWQRRSEIALAKARELLREPLPDMFLGRRHHEPIPLPYQKE